MKLDRTPPQTAGAAPGRGEHTDRVLVDLLGFEADEVAGLRADGAI